MHITQLHTLARRELNSLASARYMPRGYDRQASQRAERKMYELGKYLDGALSLVADCFLVYPTHHQLQALLANAAKERTLQAMVAKMVQLMAALPPVDQGDAHALTEIAERLASAERVTTLANKTRSEFEVLVGHAARLELNFNAVFAALKDLVTQADSKAAILTDNKCLLTQDN